jgi:hypothetical protein
MKLSFMKCKSHALGLIIFITTISLLNSCEKKKTNLPVPPVVTTSSLSDITFDKATSGGNVTDDSGEAILARGVCWGTSANPTTADSKTSDGDSLGSFSSNIIGLNETSTYHVRAYATNSAGTGYGEDLEFITLLNPLKIGLMAYYPLDGNANDESGNNLNGIMHGTELTTNHDNTQGKALTFSGNSYISLGSNFDFPLRTINIWFYATVIDLTERHIYISDSPALLNGFTQIKVKEVDGMKTIRSSAGIPGGVAEGSTQILLNKWYMLTLVVDSSKTRHYLNGELIGIFDNGLSRSNNGDALALLGTSRVYDRFFIGKLDDVRIYNRALSEIEIQSLLDY